MSGGLLRGWLRFASESGTVAKVVAKCNHLRYHEVMPHRPFAGQQCSIAGSLEVLGERWTLLVMREVLLGRRRFADIKRNTGVAPNILSDRLSTLVDQGLLRRRLYSEGAAGSKSYEYVPTRKGVEVNPILQALLEWGDRHATPEGGPPRVIVHTACGHDAHPQMHCSHCGDPLLPGETLVRPGPGATPQQQAEGPLPSRSLANGQ
jgi:DNA-binding HxlR family transcriptional regulator